MSTPVKTTLDFTGGGAIVGIASSTAAGQPVEHSQLAAAIEGLKSKDPAVTSASSNVNLAAPGAAVGGVTMVSGDRFVAYGQTAGAENGIYVWNGAATPATRSLDANTLVELAQAIIPITGGPDAGTTLRQTVTSGTLGVTTLSFVTFGTNVPAASEATAGRIEIATQAETDAGTDDARAVTPLKLATYAGAVKSFSAVFGDGSATSAVITHNLNTKKVGVSIFETGGSERQTVMDVERTSVNSVTIRANAAIANGGYQAIVTGKV